jgi:hypothetical protein
MADVSTSDRPPSKVRDEVILEAQRLEESTRDSSKGHHCAAERWSKRGNQLGIPTAIISGITSLAVFAQASKDIWWIGAIAAILSVIVTILTTLTTVLKPTDRENAHLAAGNAYNKLNNATRVFWSIECWTATATEESMAAKLNDLVAQKDALNAESPQVPPWAWAMAKERIAKGESTYAVDKAKPPAPAAELPPPGPQPHV